MFQLLFSETGLKGLQMPDDNPDIGVLAHRYAFLEQIAEPLQRLDDEIRRAQEQRHRLKSRQ